MDHYEIGATIQGAANMAMVLRKGKGRTTSMLNQLVNGDRVITINQDHADMLRRLVRERKLSVEVLVLSPENPEVYKYPPMGKTHLDHVWVEAYYQHVLARAIRDVDHIQAELSGRTSSVPNMVKSTVRAKLKRTMK